MFQYAYRLDNTRGGKAEIVWDKNKEKQMKYQTSPGNKPRPNITLTIKEEFVITLVRLRLGLMGRHQVHVLSVSQSQLSRIFTTWVCFLVYTGTLAK